MKATKLTNLRITRVDLVDKGANYDPETGEGAHVLLYKRDQGGNDAYNDSLDATTPAKRTQKEIDMAAKAKGKAKGGKSLQGAGSSGNPRAMGDPTGWDQDEDAHQSSPSAVKDDAGEIGDEEEADVAMDDAADTSDDDDSDVSADAGDTSDDDDSDVAMDDASDADDDDDSSDAGKRKAKTKAKAAKRDAGDTGVLKAEVVSLRKMLATYRQEASVAKKLALRLHNENELRKFEDHVRKSYAHIPGLSRKDLAKLLKSLAETAPAESWKQLEKILGTCDEAIAAGPLFKEIGSGAADDDADVVTKVNKLVEAQVTKGEHKTKQDALSAIFKAHPEWYREYRAGSSVRVGSKNAGE